MPAVVATITAVICSSRGSGAAIDHLIRLGVDRLVELLGQAPFVLAQNCVDRRMPRDLGRLLPDIASEPSVGELQDAGPDQELVPAAHAEAGCLLETDLAGRPEPRALRVDPMRLRLAAELHEGGD